MAQAFATALMTLVVASLAAVDSPAPMQPRDAVANAQQTEPVVTVAAPRVPLGDVPWCSDADDPRCSRDERGAAGGSGDSHVPVTIGGLERPTGAAVDGEPQVWAENAGLSPRAGFLSPIERPPQ